MKLEFESSNLYIGEYDVKTGTLVIEFHNGVQYEYLKVPKDVVIDLKSANSQGKFYNQNIKGNYGERKK